MGKKTSCLACDLKMNLVKWLLGNWCPGKGKCTLGEWNLGECNSTIYLDFFQLLQVLKILFFAKQHSSCTLVQVASQQELITLQKFYRQTRTFRIFSFNPHTQFLFKTIFCCLKFVIQHLISMVPNWQLTTNRYTISTKKNYFSFLIST